MHNINCSCRCRRRFGFAPWRVPTAFHLQYYFLVGLGMECVRAHALCVPTLARETNSELRIRSIYCENNAQTKKGRRGRVATATRSKNYCKFLPFLIARSMYVCAVRLEWPVLGMSIELYRTANGVNR